MLWVRISIRARCTTLCDNTFCQWLATGQWFSQGPPVSSTNKTESHDKNIVESGVKHYQTNKQKNMKQQTLIHYTLTQYYSITQLRC